MLKTDDKMDLGPFLRYFVMRNPFETTQTPQNDVQIKLEDMKTSITNTELPAEKWGDEISFSQDTNFKTKCEPISPPHIDIKVEKEDKSYDKNLNKKITCRKWRRKRQVSFLLGKVLLARARSCRLQGQLRRKHETLRRLKCNYTHVKQQLTKLHHTFQQISRQLMNDMNRIDKL